MAFVKGQSGNPNGRPKGAKNKASVSAMLTAQILRNAIVDLFSDYKETKMKDDLMSLSPENRLKMIRKFLDIATRLDCNSHIDLSDLIKETTDED